MIDELGDVTGRLMTDVHDGVDGAREDEVEGGVEGMELLGFWLVNEDRLEIFGEPFFAETDPRGRRGGRRGDLSIRCSKAALAASIKPTSGFSTGSSEVAANPDGAVADDISPRKGSSASLIGGSRRLLRGGVAGEAEDADPIEAADAVVRTSVADDDCAAPRLSSSRHK